MAVFKSSCDSCSFECESCNDCDSCNFEEDDCFSCLELYGTKTLSNMFGNNHSEQPEKLERADCKECHEALRDHGGLSANSALIKSKDNEPRNSMKLKDENDVANDNSKVRSWINEELHSSKSFKNYEEKPVWYCHWNHDHGEEVSFNDILDLDDHLKQHIETSDLKKVKIQNSEDTSLAAPCQWDSCDASLDMIDDMLAHVKKEHYSSSSFPHQNCMTYSEVPSSGSSSGTSFEQHNSALPSPEDGILNQDPLKCQYDTCNFNTLDSDAYFDHLNKHAIAQQNGISPLQCEWKACAFVGNDMKELSVHMKNYHNPPVTPDPDELKMSFPVKEKEESDGISDESSSMFKCKWECSDGGICGEIFHDTSELSAHIISSHIGSRKQQYMCCWQGCERNHRPFQQRQKIIRHLQTHSKNKPFRCSVCNHRFAEESVLKQHMRTHSGERPFECKVCGKTFAASTALSVHLRVHTGEKPLKCKFPGCDKRFSESSNLNKHMKTHMAVKNYKCTCCQKQFCRYDQFQKHLKTHLQQISDMEKSYEQGTIAA